MILITGASSGIGEACARVFAHDPQTDGLVLVARRKARLDRLKRELEKQRPGLKVHALTLDVSRRKDVDAFVKKHRKLLAGVKVLINNAGLARGLSTMQEASVEDWEVMIDTNVKGVLYLTRALLPVFIERDEGHIVNLGSVAGHWVYPKGNIYCATKFAVRAINEALRVDLLGRNIRVTSISPGMVETEFSEVRLGDAKKAKAVYEGMTPLSAMDIAEAIHWCVRRPKHVNVQDMVLYPTVQAQPTMVARKS